MIFFLFFTCFLSQCVFQLKEEHLLLIISTILFVFCAGLLIEFVQGMFRERNLTFVKQIIKGKILREKFQDVLSSEFYLYQKQVFDIFHLNVILIEELDLLFSEIKQKSQILAMQLKINEQLMLLEILMNNQCTETDLVFSQPSSFEF